MSNVPPKRQTRLTPGLERPNTVNLRLNALNDLLDKMERRGTSPASIPKRRVFARWPFRRETVQIEVEHPGGNATTIRVACRNLSRGGLGVLHNAYIHTGSECRVLLTHREHGETWIDGRIVRCIHRGGVVHELGIQFAEPIVLAEFLPNDPFAPSFSLERVDPQTLTGGLLHVSSELAERQLLRRMLQNTRLSLTSVPRVEDVFNGGKNLDLALIDVAPEEAESVACRLREMGYPGAILMIAPDASPRSRQFLKNAPCRSILVKPLSADTLLRALGEVLLVDLALSCAPIEDLEREPENPRMPHACRELQAAMQDDNPRASRMACLRLADEARQLGWGSVAALATAAARDLGRQETIGTSRNALLGLLEAFRAA